MATPTGEMVDGLSADDADGAIRAVLHETLDLLRAALASLLGDDGAAEYGLD